MVQKDTANGPRRKLGAAAGEYERSMAVAARALHQIKALNLPATPRNYEICYAYATGHYPSLNQIIDDMLARQAPLGPAVLEKLAARFLSPGDTKDRIETVGTRFASEIDHVLGSIHASIDSAAAHSADFTKLDGMAGRVSGHPALLGGLVQKMMMTANRIGSERRSLEDQLAASKTEITRLREQLQTIRAATLTDPLTGLANRASFEDALPQALAEAAQRGEPLSLVMSDIDLFKTFNDAWGHPTGDQVLCLLATEMKQSLAGRGAIHRIGGEEFAMILPGAPLPSARTMADTIRGKAMARNIASRSTGKTLGRVTISFGVAAAQAGDTPESLFERADACLLGAKRHGGNRVISETDPEFASVRAA
jgi:diguanylate cyclase